MCHMGLSNAKKSLMGFLQVSRAISLKIRGLQHRARAVFSLGNTVFVDPMVRWRFKFSKLSIASLYSHLYRIIDIYSNNFTFRMQSYIESPKRS